MLYAGRLVAATYVHAFGLPAFALGEVVALQAFGRPRREQGPAVPIAAVLRHDIQDYTARALLGRRARRVDRHFLCASHVRAHRRDLVMGVADPEAVDRHPIIGGAAAVDRRRHETDAVGPARVLRAVRHARDEDGQPDRRAGARDRVDHLVAHDALLPHVLHIDNRRLARHGYALFE